ncbi:MAG TPA: MarR family transcriptional regulator [Actinomycetes bacterium]
MSPDRTDHVDEIVAQWHRERPDLDTGPLATLGRLFRVAELAHPLLSAPLRELGLQPGWLDLLAALRRAGAPYELNPTELMRATMLSSGGMTKRLDRLADAGLVERRPDPGDRRGTLVRLTARGKATIDQAIGVHVRNEARLLDALTTAERRALDRSLRALLAGLEGERPSAGARTGGREERPGAARPARGPGRKVG